MDVDDEGIGEACDACGEPADGHCGMCFQALCVACEYEAPCEVGGSHQFEADLGDE